MKRKALLVSILIMLIIGGTSGFFVYYFLFRQTNLSVICVDSPFTSYPVEMDRLDSITPLGNLNPPGHTFPTDHMYFNCDRLTYPDGFEIYAPGNLTITRLSKVEYDPPQVGISEDYSIEFTVCNKIWGRFGHVNNLSSNLLNEIDDFGEEYGDEVYEWEVAGRDYTSYNKRVTLKVTSGLLLGRAGYMGGYDFWLKDERVNLFWVNSEWTQEFQNTVCPLDYFTDTIKNDLYAKVAGWGGQPTDPPEYGGKIDFDIANTAQGIWLRDGWTTRREDNGLSLVYSNFNASKGAISVGYALDSSWDSQVYLFNPQNNGFMNRNFSQVTNDGNIYYYYCEGFEYGTGYDQVVLLKMIGNRALYIQYIDQSGSLLPADPTVLFDELSAIYYTR
jgi:hypothetical protein